MITNYFKFKFWTTYPKNVKIFVRKYLLGK